MDLSGKVAIVTGAGQGIGRATALELAKTGAIVAVCGIRENIEAVKGEIESMDKQTIAVRMDVSRWVDAERMAKQVIERFGRIDILVSNAGIAINKKDGTRPSILEIEDSTWDKILNVNLKGFFNCCKAVVPFMIKQRSGRIVSVGSTTAFTGVVSTAPYVASKGGIIAMTRALARELGPYNIHVNSVSPGMVLTQMNKDKPQAVFQGAVSATSLGRIAEPVDVARAILHLVSEDLFLTGQAIIVDGGHTMH